jgi:2-polyprenyl-3-methyl-5-hydroxy-6-metoxy-1,4-benzoquinol methylase
MCKYNVLNKILSFPISAIDGIYNKNYKAPLTLLVCTRCGQVQLREVINPALYKDYNFAAENIVTIKKWCGKLSKIILSTTEGGTILEVGSGDGYFAHLLSQKSDVICIEPSAKLVKEARKKFKLKTICNYYDDRIHLNKKFDIVITRHVMEHIENVKEFVKKLVGNIKEEGMIVVEVPDLRTILKAKNYANLFHEHINYFSPQTLSQLFEPYGLYPTMIMGNEVHGGAMCIFFKRDVKKKINLEDKVNRKTLDKFSKGFIKYKKNMQSVGKVTKEYKKVCGYGAANKTFKLLSLMGIRRNQIKYVFDKNKNLHGQTIPQFGIKIIDPEKIMEISPDLIVILATSYEKEITKDLKTLYRYKGDILSLNDYIQG